MQKLCTELSAGSSAQVLNESIFQVIHMFVALSHQQRVHVFIPRRFFYRSLSLSWPPHYLNSHPFLGAVHILCDLDGGWARATECVSYHHKKPMPVTVRCVLTIARNQCTTKVQWPQPQNVCRSPLTHCQWQWLWVSQLLSTGPITFFILIAIQYCQNISKRHAKSALFG